MSNYNNDALIEKDARIAELTAEVARYKAGLEEIVDSFDSNSSTLRTIARNALREVG